MPRKPRTEVECGIFHVYARGNRSTAIFLDDKDRRRYLTLLADVVAEQRWWCLQYCLMTTHVHLLIETTEPNLGDGMRRLHGDYAACFNRRHKFSGHLFGGRFGAERVKDDRQFVTVLRYLDRNPVEANMVPRPEAWPWSSAAALRGGAAPSWLALDRLRELLPGGTVPLEG